MAKKEENTHTHGNKWNKNCVSEFPCKSGSGSYIDAITSSVQQQKISPRLEFIIVSPPDTSSKLRTFSHFFTHIRIIRRLRFILSAHKSHDIQYNNIFIFPVTCFIYSDAVGYFLFAFVGCVSLGLANRFAWTSIFLSDCIFRLDHFLRDSILVRHNNSKSSCSSKHVRWPWTIFFRPWQ